MKTVKQKRKHKYWNDTFMMRQSFQSIFPDKILYYFLRVRTGSKMHKEPKRYRAKYYKQLLNIINFKH